MMRGGALLLATALLAAGCHKGEQGAPASNVAAENTAAAVPAGGLIDRVVLTPDGGYRMGDPAAKVRLVEYGSYTCPHCALFAEEAMPGIKRRVATGKLSFEYRPYAREIFDLTAALVTRCAGPAGFFPLTEQILAEQDRWTGNAQNMAPADQDRIDKLPPDQQFKALAHATQLDAIAAKHGIDAARLDACLTDPKAIAAIVDVHDRANKDHDIRATPMFLLGDTLIPSADWKSLQPQLDAAVGA